MERIIDGGDVLNYLIPTGGWTITGDNYDSIRYDKGVVPVTKKQFEDGFILAKKAKEFKEIADAANKAALLDRLGITADEAKLLLS